MTSPCSGKTSAKINAQAQPIAVWPEGYEPSLRKAASSSGVQVGALFTIKGRFR